MTDAERIAVKLDQLAAWRLPGGPKPTFPMPDEYEAATEAASLIRSQAERIKRLTEAVGSRAIHEEYDFPGDAPEFCGWFCDECKSVIEADGSGHDANCLAHGIKPLGKRADKARARAAMEPRNG